jgi:hypothetical protein
MCHLLSRLREPCITDQSLAHRAVLSLGEGDSNFIRTLMDSGRAQRGHARDKHAVDLLYRERRPKVADVYNQWEIYEGFRNADPKGKPQNFHAASYETFSICDGRGGRQRFRYIFAFHAIDFLFGHGFERSKILPVFENLRRHAAADTVMIVFPVPPQAENVARMLKRERQISDYALDTAKGLVLRLAP